MPLANDLQNAVEQSAEGFVSITALRKIITETSVQEYLKSRIETDSVANEHAPFPTAREIVHKMPKLLAVLLYCNFDEYLRPFLGQDQSDAMFPASLDSELFSKNEHWEKFHLNQWKIAPLMNTSVHLDPPLGIDLSDLFRGQRMGRGTFGVVYSVKVAEGHMEGISELTELARKYVRADEDNPSKPLSTVMREIEVMRSRKHDNILPILCSFTLRFRSENADAVEGRQVHIVTPRFKMNMGTWTECHPGWDVFDQRQYLYQCTDQILRGLAALHRRDEQFKATAHHDLKPTNILVNPHKMVIADLGSASLKSMLDGSAVSEGRAIGTYEYHPPEYFDQHGSPDLKIKHGRAYDMWSMGCIMLQVAILIVWGWESKMVQAFEDDRKKLADERRRFLPRDDESRKAFHNSIPVIDTWLAKMQNSDLGDAKEGRKLREYLRLAVSMLKSEPNTRIFSWEALIDLYDLLNPHVGHFERQQHILKFIEAPDENKADCVDTPLYRAIERGDHFRVSLLVTAGWSISAKNCSQKTPIDIAKELEHCLRILAKPREACPLGSNVHVIDSTGCGFSLNQSSQLSNHQMVPRPGIWPEPDWKTGIQLEVPQLAKTCLLKWLDTKDCYFLYLWGDPKSWVKPTVQKFAEKMRAKGHAVIFTSITSEPYAESCTERLTSFSHHLLASLGMLQDVRTDGNDLEQILAGISMPKVPIIVILWGLDHKLKTGDRSPDMLEYVTFFQKYSKKGLMRVLIVSRSWKRSARWEALLKDGKHQEITNWGGPPRAFWH